jgi:hypothetical protein
MSGKSGEIHERLQSEYSVSQQRFKQITYRIGVKRAIATLTASFVKFNSMDNKLTPSGKEFRIQD